MIVTLKACFSVKHQPSVKLDNIYNILSSFMTMTNCLLSFRFTTFLFKRRKKTGFRRDKGQTSIPREDGWRTKQWIVQIEHVFMPVEASGEPQGAVQTAAGRRGEREGGQQGEDPVSGEVNNRERERKGNWDNRRTPQRETKAVKCSVEAGEEKGRPWEVAAEHRESAAEWRGRRSSDQDDREEAEFREERWRKVRNIPTFKKNFQFELYHVVVVG